MYFQMVILRVMIVLLFKNFLNYGPIGVPHRTCAHGFTNSLLIL